jgi:hypothetical protein
MGSCSFIVSTIAGWHRLMFPRSGKTAMFSRCLYSSRVRKPSTMNRKLTNGSFSEILQAHQEYEVTRDQSGPLAAELQRLRALGLIEGHGIMDFCKPDRQKRKINEWFRLTTRGEEYLQMRTDNERDLFGASEAEKTIAPNPVPLPSAELVGRNDSSERG